MIRQPPQKTTLMVPAQYFGRCDTTYRRACLIGARDGAGRIYRVGLPLTDLKVTLDGVELKAGFALGGWLAFEKIGDHLALLHALLGQ